MNKICFFMKKKKLLFQGQEGISVSPGPQGPKVVSFSLLLWQHCIIIHANSCVYYVLFFFSEGNFNFYVAGETRPIRSTWTKSSDQGACLRGSRVKGTGTVSCNSTKSSLPFQFWKMTQRFLTSHCSLFSDWAEYFPTFAVAD